ncbi:uncharacterized protein V1510DRAFT_427689 [Dipodascopsis tothii]|uniref:uncharacterized protein n=1 Tax=Dipodascopsis tothii TaxID=44089 RepID=UPI0034CF29BD
MLQSQPTSVGPGAPAPGPAAEPAERAAGGAAKRPSSIRAARATLSRKLSKSATLFSIFSRPGSTSPGSSSAASSRHASVSSEPACSRRRSSALPSLEEDDSDSRASDEGAGARRLPYATASARAVLAGPLSFNTHTLLSALRELRRLGGTGVSLDRKTFVLLPTALLRYGLPPADSAPPELALTLRPDSVAYASDELLGYQYVLRVSEHVDARDRDDDGPLGHAPRTVLLVYDNSAEFMQWMTAIRAQIKALKERTAHSPPAPPARAPSPPRPLSYAEDSNIISWRISMLASGAPGESRDGMSDLVKDIKATSRMQRLTGRLRSPPVSPTTPAFEDNLDPLARFAMSTPRARAAPAGPSDSPAAAVAGSRLVPQREAGHAKTSSGESSLSSSSGHMTTMGASEGRPPLQHVMHSSRTNRGSQSSITVSSSSSSSSSLLSLFQRPKHARSESFTMAPLARFPSLRISRRTTDETPEPTPSSTDESPISPGRNSQPAAAESPVVLSPMPEIEADTDGSMSDHELPPPGHLQRLSGSYFSPRISTRRDSSRRSSAQSSDSVLDPPLAPPALEGAWTTAGRVADRRESRDDDIPETPPELPEGPVAEETLAARRKRAPTRLPIGPPPAGPLPPLPPGPLG